MKALAQAERKPEELKHIAITHHHIDHTGSLAALVAVTGARTYVHPLDAEGLRGDKIPPTSNREILAARVLGPIIDRLFHPKLETMQPDQEVNDGEELQVAGGMRAIHSPGHTPGHLSYLWPQHGGVLFAGDAAGKEREEKV